MRKINEYERPAHIRGRELMQGVDKLPARQREDKLVLFLGTGRCGTTFTEKVMRKIGLDVKHERTGRDGCVSQFFYVDADWYPVAPWTNGKRHVGERRSDFRFQHVLHIVRDPLKSIPSMTGIYGSLLWEFHIQHGMIPRGARKPLERAAHLWLNLNRACAEQSVTTFQVERYEQAWGTISALLGKPGARWPALPPTNKASGFRKREPITFDDLENAVGVELSNRIHDQAFTYGYRY